MSEGKFNQNNEYLNPEISARRIDNGKPHPELVARGERKLKAMRQMNKELDQLLQETDNNPSIIVENRSDKVGLLTKMRERIKNSKNSTKMVFIGGAALAFALFGNSSDKDKAEVNVPPAISKSVEDPSLNIKNASTDTNTNKEINNEIVEELENGDIVITPPIDNPGLGQETIIIEGEDNGIVEELENGDFVITPPIDNPDLGQEKIIIEGDK